MMECQHEMQAGESKQVQYMPKCVHHEVSLCRGIAGRGLPAELSCLLLDHLLGVRLM
jgi:hypothetical protein